MAKQCGNAREFGSSLLSQNLQMQLEIQAECLMGFQIA